MLRQFASTFISRRVPCQFHLRRMMKQQKEAVTELQQLLRCTRPSGTGGAGSKLMFPIDDHVGGPPYKVTVSDYEEVLHPMGFKAISIFDNDLAVQPRQGREKLGRWKRSAAKSAV